MRDLRGTRVTRFWKIFTIRSIGIRIHMELCGVKLDGCWGINCQCFRQSRKTNRKIFDCNAYTSSHWYHWAETGGKLRTNDALELQCRVNVIPTIKVNTGTAGRSSMMTLMSAELLVQTQLTAPRQKGNLA